jgi:hypothetical protein
MKSPSTNQRPQKNQTPTLKFIVIQLQGKEVKLTLDEARKLHRELGCLFPSLPPVSPVDRPTRPTKYETTPIWCSTRGDTIKIG